MVTLDSSIVNISLPKISSYFKAPLSGEVEWIVISYLIVIASLLLTMGRLSDIMGRKPLWMCGLAIFSLGSASCGAAPSLLFLVISRALQGVGGAMVMSVSPAMITDAFSFRERGKAMGLIGAVVAVGTCAGPTLGGIITQTLSWRWIFYINVPFGIIGILATLRLVTAPTSLGAARSRFDHAGAALLSTGVILLMLTVTFGQEAGWLSIKVLGALAASGVIFTLFLILEARVAHPIVDLSIFRNRIFSSGLISSFLCYLSLFAVMFLMPFYLEVLLLLPPDRAGLFLTAVPIAVSFAAPISGWLSDRFGSRMLCSLGMAAGAAGLFLLGRLSQHRSTFAIIAPLVLAGLGQGMFLAPNSNAIMSSAPENRIGVASGFMATVRVLGQGFSVAISGAIFTSLGGARTADRLAQNPLLHAPLLQSTFIHAFHTAMLTGTVIASLGALASFSRGHSLPRSGTLEV